MNGKKSCVLAYSGGLDTSAIIPWLVDKRYDVHAVLVDVGQCEDLDALRNRALELGAVTATIRDARPAMLEAAVPLAIGLQATYEGSYRLGTALARPFIALEQVRLAKELGCTALAHGATGKGNDQVRFEFAYRSLAPNCEVIAPWKEWSFEGRQDLVDYLRSKGVPYHFEVHKELSLDENLFHLSVEGGVLENPERALRIREILAAVSDRFYATKPPGAVQAPSVTVGFQQGVPVSLDGEPLSLQALIDRLNENYRTADWAWDLVLENRFTGVKSRGIYINPAAKLLHLAVDGLARASLSKPAYDEYRELGCRYADVLYRGEYFSQQRRVVEAGAKAAVAPLTGEVTVHLDPAPYVAKVVAESALFTEDLATFEKSAFSHGDAAGFIRLSWLSSIATHESGEVFDEHDDTVEAVPGSGSGVFSDSELPDGRLVSPSV